MKASWPMTAAGKPICAGRLPAAVAEYANAISASSSPRWMTAWINQP